MAKQIGDCERTLNYMGDLLWSNLNFYKNNVGDETSRTQQLVNENFIVLAN